MAYKTMTLTVGPNVVDSYIDKLGRAVQSLDGVDLEISLKPLNAQVAIKVKVLKFTGEHTWQDIATKLSQQLMLNVLLTGHVTAIYSNNKSIVLS